MATPVHRDRILASVFAVSVMSLAVGAVAYAGPPDPGTVWDEPLIVDLDTGCRDGGGVRYGYSLAMLDGRGQVTVLDDGTGVVQVRVAGVPQDRDGMWTTYARYQASAGDGVIRLDDHDLTAAGVRWDGVRIKVHGWSSNEAAAGGAPCLASDMGASIEEAV